MKYYAEMVKMKCFCLEDILSLAGNRNTAKAVLNSYLKKGYIAKIRRDLYTAIDFQTSEGVANRFEIASKISPSSIVSHHSAFEFYGYANQVAYVIDVTSLGRFSKFEFEGFEYIRQQPGISEGIAIVNGNVKVTDIERTVLDSINDFNKVMGLEETLRCISIVPQLNEDKLIRYLQMYDKCFLFQKTGFILQKMKKEFDLSDEFFDYCKCNMGKSTRYLLEKSEMNDRQFDSEWNLIVPKRLWENVYLEGEDDIEV